MKNSTKIVILLAIFIALITIALALFNQLNEIIALIIVFICSAIFLSTLFVSQVKLDRLGARKIIELKSKRKINNKTTRNIITIISLVMMAGVFILISNMQINNYYIYIYVVVHLVFTIIFLVPRKLVIDYNAIHCFPNCKVKWADLKDYQLDKNEGILILQKVNDQKIQVRGIQNQDFKAIESMIKKYNEGEK